MIPHSTLVGVARARLADAEALYVGARYDGAAYLCGYVVEIALKARIVRTLRWAGFPETRKEFEAFQSFRTHALESLLRLSGVEHKITGQYLAIWSEVADWNPENRYLPAGQVAEVRCRQMIEAARVLMRYLCRT